MQHHPDADLWFPEEVLYVGEFTGPSYKATYERVKFTKVQLQQPIDPEAFTVKALGAPAGTGIARSYDKPGLSEIWNGTEVVPRTSQRTPIQPANVEPRSWRLPLLIAGKVLLLLGIAGWTYLQRQRRA